jgi:hypothetical protein
VDLIRGLPECNKDLKTHQKLMVYEGLGWMVSVIRDPYF